MGTEVMTGWDGVSDLYEEDQPLEVVGAIVSRPYDFVTAQPPSVLDVAQGFLDRLGDMDSWKLQKLCYYVQAKHLARYDEPLFRERIEAWPAGPVVPELWTRHRGIRTVKSVAGADTAALADHPTALACMDEVEKVFGEWTGAQLSELSHREAPWAEARVGLKPKEPSNREIEPSAIKAFYQDLEPIPADEYEITFEPPF